ncbi:PREDICTED: 14 kDa phosphohistidine phosphatase-like [Priapulus caudatus]|uniref:14 kDa phosphohistidine phosphatase-like n=1 Tax=Priapulus caudatus TaxID=37621 RepID=A0ABM1DQX6_PRICU|nr:PREDICTED: 14 kDa phosphohistidine phosphatase-like [Priapulus caudatus]XP_014662347.1 PREDICTED: 14 kDa phosphohistidine phosphatase-like [Priapulus caudatus]XP_014662348.1 PREDICTED: 14 kDa phosphohistidine phosphatase-like [Priapulus caudatus]
MSFDAVADVDIDPKGRFKYILVKVFKDDDLKNFKYIVRGYLRAGYHGDVLEEVEPGIRKAGLDVFCTGGGRIEHDPTAKTLKVYGHSTGYGKADHEISVEILKKKYPEYNITCSDDGY